jgi:hypothetical protein
LMTHDGEASVIMIHPHFNSAGKKVSSFTTGDPSYVVCLRHTAK